VEIGRDVRGRGIPPTLKLKCASKIFEMADVSDQIRSDQIRSDYVRSDQAPAPIIFLFIQDPVARN
jgi:hypothetical protein